MIRTRRNRAPAIAAAAVAVGVLSLLPLLYLFLSGVSVQSIRDFFTYPDTAGIIGRTIGLTLSITFTCIVLGVGGALIVIRTDVPLRRLLTVVLAAPLAVPLFVSSYAAYSANLVFAAERDIVTSFLGATVIMAFGLYPYVFLATAVALAGADPAQEDAARSLGAGPVRVFFRVVVPQLRTALASSGLIIALHVLSEYGAMAQTRQRTLTTSVMSDMLDFGNYESARSTSLLLIVLAVFVIGGAKLLNGRTRPMSIGSQTVRSTRRARLGRARWPALLLTLLLPVAALGPTVFMTVRGLASPHRDLVVSWPLVFSSAGVSLSYMVWAGLIGTLVALPVSLWAVRRPSRWSDLTERSVWLAHAVPSAVLALALVFLANQLLPGLYKTAPLLIIAYVILFLPLAVSNQMVGFQTALRKYDDAAASLGRGPFHRFSRVTLPIALPGIASGALLLGLDAGKELTTTLMLLPFNTATLATGLWGTTEGESLDFTAAAPYALLLIVLGAIPVYLIVRHTVRHIH